MRLATESDTRRGPTRWSGRLEELGWIDPRTAVLIRGALRQETAGISSPWDEIIRAKLLRSMLTLVFHERD